jgi:hypothetical protein
VRWLTHQTGRIDKHPTRVTRDMVVPLAGRNDGVYQNAYNATRGIWAGGLINAANEWGVYNWRWPSDMTKLVSAEVMFRPDSTGTWDWQADYQGTASGEDTSGGSESSDSGQLAITVNDLSLLDVTGAITSSSWVAGEWAALRITQTSADNDVHLQALYIRYQAKLIA